MFCGKLIERFGRLGCLLLLATFISACQIEGQVTVDGNPVANQRVTLEGEGLSLSTETDAKGRYRFDNVDAGFYYVSVDRPGMTQRRVEKLTNNGSIRGVHFAVSSDTLRTTENGNLLGAREANGTLVWKGIPFASAPVDELRWKAARPATDWNDDYWALDFSRPCPQLSHLQLDIPITRIGDVVGDEDCLYLNIWTPDFASVPQGNDARPVMFWIHGGGNAAGESGIFDGKMLAEKYGVIVVSTNYRLGVLGYFSHPALRAVATDTIDQTSNFATTDLIQSLRWVQNNISAFGGDPDRVMIFGESAGAANVAALMASPAAEGLFHRAVMQSGGIGWATQFEAEQFAADTISQYLVADGTVNSSSEARSLMASMSDSELVNYLKGKTISELLAHFDGSRFGMYSHPGVTRDGIMIPDRDPYELFGSGDYHQVPVITGTNRDETKIFMAFNPEFTPGGLPIFVKEPAYFNLSAYYQSTLWRAGVVDEFAAATAGQPNAVFTYRFDWDEEPKILWNDVAVTVGASHFFEIPFVFNTPDTFTVPIASPLLFTPSAAEGRQILSDSMSSYWAAFAYHGDPGFGFNDSEPVQWGSWSDQPGEENIIIFDSINDAGIRMIEDRISFESVQLQLQQETGFPKPEQKCITYLRGFGADAWYNANCL